MSISAALTALYRERDRLDEERGRIDEAIVALEGISTSPQQAASRSPKKADGRSAPKPPVDCPFCGATAKGMAGLAAHVRGSHPDQYPDAYEDWKRQSS
jgi:hypothetical protein